MWIGFWVQVILCSPGLSQPEDRVIRLNEKFSLRDLAREHLGDPDQWRVILLYNGFENLSDLPHQGTITIPAALFKEISKKLDQAGGLIHQASMEGAGVLARENLSQAVRFHAQGLELRSKGQMDKAMENADQALKYSQQALSETRGKRVRSVSALLARKHGQVQSRGPENPLWIDAEVHQEFVEKERVRTLKSSRGQILFVDGSQLNLDEDSLTVIGQMKENLIESGIKTDVTVLRGDVLFQLAALSPKKTFSVMSPGVAADVRSTYFRTSRDAGEVTRITNYDGEIDVTAQGRAVKVGKNEGTKIESGKGPDAPQKLLPAPVITRPGLNQTIRSETVSFEWEAVADAASYRLEIAEDREFLMISFSQDITSTRHVWTAPRSGAYYFRFHTRDAAGLSGPFSTTGVLFMNLDHSPPYLAVQEPSDGETIPSDEVTVRGEAEKGAMVKINGLEIPLQADGGFIRQVHVKKGEQTLTITARDASGNEAVLNRKIVSVPGTRLVVLDTPNPLILNKTPVPISGEIRPGARLEINGETQPLSGKFSWLLNLTEGAHEVQIRAFRKPGEDQEIRLYVTVDLTPPQITADPFPAYTPEARADLSGRLSEPARVMVNGRPVETEKDRFKLTLNLAEGPNVFDLTAVDPAGNKTGKTLSIFRDSLPPEILRHGTHPPKTRGGEIASLTVEARDQGMGLAKTGRFVLHVSDQTLNGILTLNPANNMFNGSLFIPPGASGPVVITEIRIQDRLGNETVGP